MKTKPQIIADLSELKPDTNSVHELQQEMQEKRYWDDLNSSITATMKVTTKDFYIVGILRKHKLLTDNHIEHKFVTRSTCPTPDYDQTVWKYHSTHGNLEYLWTIPDREACHIYLENMIQVVPEERQLLGYIIDFADGVLMELCKKLNGETSDLELEFYLKE